MSKSRASGQRLYLPAMSAQADFTTLTPVLANGRRADFSNAGGGLYLAYNATTNPYWKVEQLGQYRGARIQFIGTGADNATANYRLWSLFGGYTANATNPSPGIADLADVTLQSVGIGVATLSAAVGTGGTGLVAAATRIADTITWTKATTATTPAGPQTVFESAYSLGASDVYSPAADVPGVLIIPDFGSGCLGFIIEFDMSGATGMNALVELTA